MKCKQIIDDDVSDCNINISDDQEVHHERILDKSTTEGDDGEAKSSENMKGSGTKKRERKERYAFQTRSQVDILDDGYRWRKYGQKAELLQVYSPRVQREEASAKVIKR
ncbi:hypothetical protein Scep_020962 [Stephania cephalantha]|uniref:WRKY domain-containing protein n=1 Tax=Stephania cephalantha TaxID=152367 RepID=A0AAP0F7M8_9MAGN